MDGFVSSRGGHVRESTEGLGEIRKGGSSSEGVWGRVDVERCFSRLWAQTLPSHSVYDPLVSSHYPIHRHASHSKHRHPYTISQMVEKITLVRGITSYIHQRHGDVTMGFFGQS